MSEPPQNRVDSAPDGPDPRRWKALTVALTAGFMTLLDVSIVNVALPSIRSALGASAAALQWIVSGYALSFGLVLVAAGRLGDARGRRVMFIAGVTVFTTASLAAGMSPNAWWLVGARLVQGMGAGLINPQVSGLIQQLFRGAERGRAFGRLGTTIGISTAVGPVLGGIILAVAGTAEGWRWVFLVNLPVGVLAIFLARRYIAPVENPEPVRDLDPLGALLLGLGTVGILWPLVTEQWGPIDVTIILAGLVCLVAFWWWERHQEAVGRVPMVRLSLFSQPGYGAGALLGAVYFAGFTGVVFVLTLFLQDGLGYGPLEAGLSLTPFAVGSAMAATIGGRLVNRLGRWVVVIGLVIVGVGLLAADLVVGAQLAAATGWWLLGPLLVAGLGGGLVISPNVTLTLAHVPVHQAGTAGGVLNTGQRLATAAGIAAIGALYFGTLRQSHDPHAAAAIGLRATLVSVALALVVGVVDLVQRRSRATETAPAR